MICDECETVAHCSKHGCIPKQPDYEGAIEVSVIFHEGQRMFAVPKQPAQQEPVCDKDPQGCWSVRCQLGKQCKNTPAQRTWVGLSDLNIDELENEYMKSAQTAHQFLRAVEAKLKEKNT